MLSIGEGELLAVPPAAMCWAGETMSGSVSGVALPEVRARGFDGGGRLSPEVEVGGLM